MNKEARLFKTLGYHVFRNLLPLEQVRELRELSLGLVAADAFRTREGFKFHGSMVRVPYWIDGFAELIRSSPAMSALELLGFSDIKWISGYVISKPPGGPALWWHQDWWAWDEPCSGWATPPQAFLMYYLQDTTEWNGCLRVIPRTHRARIELHDILPEAHSEEINRSSTESAFKKHEDEVSIDVAAGDLIVGDSRILHSTFPNNSDEERVCVTLWYAPNFRRLPSILRAKMAAQLEQSEDVSADLARSLLGGLLPAQMGLPVPGPYNRRPGRQLDRRKALNQPLTATTLK